MIRSVVLGCGSYLPGEGVSNDALIARHGLDSNNEWIVQRTGISQRYIAENEATSDLATKAAREALKDANVDVKDIDAVIVATTTSDDILPAVAAKVQGNLGMERGFAFDTRAVCSGFVYALTMADNFIRLGQAKRVLVIGAETLSRIIDFKDRSTCFLFGDGAGAVVLGAEEGQGTNADRGILTTALHCDGRNYDMLKTDARGLVQMDGKEVFRHAVTNLSDVVDEVMNAINLKPEEIDWLVPHQANQRIIDGTRKKLNLPVERVVVTINKHANTSAASIPLALTAAVKEGRIKRGQLLLLNAMGAGFTWGAAVLRW